jgi:hypothetical protein
MKPNPTRVRWYSIRPFDKKLLRRLADGMLLTKFEPEVGFGFVVGDVRPGRITGRFVRKEKATRTITKPDGLLEVVHFEDFSSTPFVVTASSPQLELCNPSRRISELLSTIGDILDDRVAIVPMEASCRQWLEALKMGGCVVRTTRLVTQNIALTDTVSVKAAFSGTRDVQDEVIAFFKGRKPTAESLSGIVEFDGDSAKIRISSTGTFTFVSPPSELLLEAVRKSAASLSEI